MGMGDHCHRFVGAVGGFLTENSVLTIVWWTVPVTLFMGVAGYLFLRRATPKA